MVLTGLYDTILTHLFSLTDTIYIQYFRFPRTMSKRFQSLLPDGLIFLSLVLLPIPSLSQSDNHSVPRQWNELLLTGIRNDYARPTVHARNLFHVSAAMYDAWAAFDNVAEPYLLGKRLGEFECPFNSDIIDSIGTRSFMSGNTADRTEAISYAAHRLIKHRFAKSPRWLYMEYMSETLMKELGYKVEKMSTSYANDGPSALGNYIADCYIKFGLQDGSNEAEEYANKFYKPVNPPIEPVIPGNPGIVNMDRWQAIKLETSIDQSGNIVTDVPPFLSPEWGNVMPFSLTEKEKNIYEKDGNNYTIYFDAPSPPSFHGDSAEYYKWGFSLVSIWASHLDPSDGVLIDISPRALGNIQQFPEGFEQYHEFYDTLEGKDASQGYEQNPRTGRPYEEQMVPRGDYARVLAEFWADGPDSETPPGHWFVILNTVMDHPEFKRSFQGVGRELPKLEWDVKSYFTLGGAMHDAAITAWGLKGYHDYIRPVSAIRAMAQLGQSTSPDLPNYHKYGIPLEPGYIELVGKDDPLDNRGENRHKIKFYSWRGPDYIRNPRKHVAGVGWILAENWWPYQRPTFVQPPFAAYVSGHSTFSRAAAEVLTRLTGDAYFPGGMSDFVCEKDNFLVFETGPSMNVVLQWATYYDAADQCSLSRIWGGIHPPQDDIPGRKLGKKIGPMAFDLANRLFHGGAVTQVMAEDENEIEEEENVVVHVFQEMTEDSSNVEEEVSNDNEKQIHNQETVEDATEIEEEVHVQVEVSNNIEEEIHVQDMVEDTTEIEEEVHVQVEVSNDIEEEIHVQDIVKDENAIEEEVNVQKTVEDTNEIKEEVPFRIYRLFNAGAVPQEIVEHENAIEEEVQEMVEDSNEIEEEVNALKEMGEDANGTEEKPHAQETVESANDTDEQESNFSVFRWRWNAWG